MAKLTLDDLSQLNSTAITSVNNSWDSLVDAIENTLSRDGTAPNEMNDDLDMNSNKIYNLPEPLTDTEPLRLGDLGDVLQEGDAVIASKTQAEAGASNALVMTPLRTAQQSAQIVGWNAQWSGCVGDGVTDDTVNFQAALNSGYRTIIVPETDDFYLVGGGLIIPSETHLLGQGKPTIKLTAASQLSMFDLEDNSDIEIEKLELYGNAEVELDNTGSCGIDSDPGVSKIKIRDCFIHHFARHGMSIDGVTDAIIENNIVEDSYWAAGILISSTTQSANVKILNNTVRRTQYANIHGFFGCVGLQVIGNFCDGSNAGITVLGGGQVADNITFYQEDTGGLLTDAIIANNVCLNSGNHGMHIGGDRVIITGNVIKNPTNGGLFIAKGDNTTPDPAVQVVVTGNNIKFADRTAITAIGINLRNYTTGTISGNIIVDAYDGFEVNGIDTAGAGVSDFTICNNTITGYGHYGFRLRNKILRTQITGNKLTADSTAVTEDFRVSELSGSTTADLLLSNNPSNNADTVYAQGAGISLGTTQTLTIATGAITVPGPGYYRIDTEGAAATDDLDTINGGKVGDIIVLNSVSTSRDPTIKHNTGNILLAGAADFVMTVTQDMVMLIRHVGGTQWVSLATPANNG